MKTLSIILYLFLLAYPVSAIEVSPSLYQFALPPLKGQQDFQSFKGEARAIVIFQPQCGWCKIQARTINKMKKAGQLSNRYVAVGINGRKPALRQEAARLQLRIPLFQATPSFYKAAALDKASPVILILGREGHLLKKLRGFQDETVLAQIEAVLSKL